MRALMELHYLFLIGFAVTGLIYWMNRGGRRW